MYDSWEVCAEPGTCLSEFSTTFYSKYFLKISVLRCNVNEICSLLGFYVEQKGNYILLDCLAFGDGANRLSWGTCVITDLCCIKFQNSTSHSLELFAAHNVHRTSQEVYGQCVSGPDLPNNTYSATHSTARLGLSTSGQIVMKFNKTWPDIILLKNAFYIKPYMQFWAHAGRKSLNRLK